MKIDALYSCDAGEHSQVPKFSGLKSRAHSAINSLRAMLMLAVVGASAATAVSLGITTYAGWLRGGLLMERVMNVALGAVAVLYVHLLPVGRRTLRLPARLCAFALWGVALVVVLYAQLTFFMVSQQHAGEKRAALVPANVTPASPKRAPARTLTEISRDAANLSSDLARTETRRCVGDCASLRARETILAAQLAALRTEADEAKRREAEEDRLNDQADRNETLRANLRADPVASAVASWLHTTESRLELMLAVACAVVLEGAAIVGWQMVAVLVGRVRSRAVVAPSRDAVAVTRDVFGLPAGIATIDRMAGESVLETVAIVQEDAGGVNNVSTTVSADERMLEKIHSAVLAGTLDPTQASIRKLLRCRQPTAGRLNRLYDQRFGSQVPKSADAHATVAETSAAAHA